MFSLVSGFMNIILEKPLYKILIIGEEGVGKTVHNSYNNILINFLIIKIDIFRTTKV